MSSSMIRRLNQSFGRREAPRALGDAETDANAALPPCPTGQWRNGPNCEDDTGLPGGTVLWAAGAVGCTVLGAVLGWQRAGYVGAGIGGAVGAAVVPAAAITLAVIELRSGAVPLP